MKVYANERVETCLHTKRVQLNLDAVNGAPVCRAFSSFWAPKGHYRTTTRRMKDNCLKVEDYLQIQTSTNFELVSQSKES